MSRIIKLEAENILCLKAICITPGDASMVKITGPNDSGKTSAIKVLWMTLGGKKEIPPDAIREGQDKGYALLEIGDNGVVEYTARLNLRRRGDGTIADSLILKDEKGRTVSSPMALLRDMLGFGRAQFDALLFSNAKPKEQVEMLKTALGLDFSELDAKHEDDYAERTIVNRQAKDLAAKIGEADPDVPGDREDMGSLNEELQQATALVEQNNQRQAQIDAYRFAKEQALQLLVTHTTQLETARNALASSCKDLETAEAVAIKEVPNTDAIISRMDNAEASNERVRVHEVRLGNIKELAGLKAAADTLTASLALIVDTKTKMIESADFPIPGVKIDGDQILINGHPLANQGGAASLRFGALLVMKSNPKLRVITMDEALGKLDDESLEMLDVLLAEHNFQAIMTGPRAVGEGCIEIRDGEVVAS